MNPALFLVWVFVACIVVIAAFGLMGLAVILLDDLYYKYKVRHAARKANRHPGGHPHDPA